MSLSGLCCRRRRLVSLMRDRLRWSGPFGNRIHQGVEVLRHPAATAKIMAPT